MKNNIIIATMATAVIIGGASFYAGMSYGKKTVVTSDQAMRVTGFAGAGQYAEQPGTNRVFNGTRTNGSGVIAGEMIAMDATSITIALRGPQQDQGVSGSRIVLLSDSTQVLKTVDGALNDLLVGEHIIVTGTTNPDGSITAKTVQIRPAPTTGNMGEGTGMGIPTRTR